MAARGSLDDQVKMLLRRVEQLEARLARQRQPARHGIPRNPRPCVTHDGGETYPTEAGGTFCFWIKFVDGSFTETVGAQSATDTNRQVDAKFKALGKWVAEGTKCWAVFDKGQWWLLDAVASFDPCGAWVTDLDSEDSPDYIVGIYGGCLVKVPISTCPE